MRKVLLAISVAATAVIVTAASVLADGMAGCC